MVVLCLSKNIFHFISCPHGDDNDDFDLILIIYFKYVDIKLI